MANENISIHLYHGFIPNFIEAALERLYENVFSSLALLKAFNEQSVLIHTYVLEKDHVPNVVLLFCVQGKQVRVLNESMPISAKEIERFASHVFAHFPLVDMVSLNAVRTDLGPISFPFQRFSCLEDIVVRLPSTQDEYLASLSKAMRKNIKRYLNKTRLELPALQHRVLIGGEIEERHVHEIIALNKARMQRKQKVSTYDALETKQMIDLVKHHGFIRLIQLDGIIVAGEICTRIGNHYFSHIGAHDPRYDEYRLGTLNCYLTICECIDRGGREFHFLWGQYDYKYSLGGIQQELNHVALYRSRIHFLLNGTNALRLRCRAFARTAKNLMHKNADDKSTSGRSLRKILKLTFHFKKFVSATISRCVSGKSPALSQTSRERIPQIHIPIESIFELDNNGLKRSTEKERPLEVCND